MASLWCAPADSRRAPTSNNHHASAWAVLHFVTPRFAPQPPREGERDMSVLTLLGLACGLALLIIAVEVGPHLLHLQMKAFARWILGDELNRQRHDEA